MQLMPRLFLGAHRELRRPENVVDESLMRRIEEVRQRLKLEGKDVKPVRGFVQVERQIAPYRPRGGAGEPCGTAGH